MYIMCRNSNLCLWRYKLVQYFCLHATNDILEFSWLATWLRCVLCVGEWGTHMFGKPYTFGHFFCSYFCTLHIGSSKLVQYFCLHATNYILVFKWLYAWQHVLCAHSRISSTKDLVEMCFHSTITDTHLGHFGCLCFNIMIFFFFKLYLQWCKICLYTVRTYWCMDAPIGVYKHP